MQGTAVERIKGSPQERSSEQLLGDKQETLKKLVAELLIDHILEIRSSHDTMEIQVNSQDIEKVCQLLKDQPLLSFRLLLCLAVVDYKDYLQVVYVLLSIEHEHKLVIKADVSYENPHIPTVTPVWRGANWYEREAHDLFGIVFDNHPNMDPLVLFEGFEGYPGRKEYDFHDYQEF